MRINSLFVALFTTSILTIGVGMSATSDSANQYITATVGTPGYIDIWPYSTYMSWKLNEGSNTYDSGDEQGPEDWFVSSNKDWYAEVFDANWNDGHFYSNNYGYLADQLSIYPYTYGYGNASPIKLSNSHQTLWSGPAGFNMWLDTAYEYNVAPDEPEDFAYLNVGAYAYTTY
jgi:hypothetical protein